MVCLLSASKDHYTWPPLLVSRRFAGHIDHVQKYVVCFVLLRVPYLLILDDMVALDFSLLIVVLVAHVYCIPIHSMMLSAVTPVYPWAICLSLHLDTLLTMFW